MWFAFFFFVYFMFFFPKTTLRCCVCVLRNGLFTEAFVEPVDRHHWAQAKIMARPAEPVRLPRIRWVATAKQSYSSKHSMPLLFFYFIHYYYCFTVEHTQNTLICTLSCLFLWFILKYLLFCVTLILAFYVHSFSLCMLFSLLKTYHCEDLLINIMLS